MHATESGGDNADRVKEANKIMGMGLLAHLQEMSEWEQGFVTSMGDRLKTYGDRTTVSANQIFKLRDIKDQHL